MKLTGGIPLHHSILRHLSLFIGFVLLVLTASARTLITGQAQEFNSLRSAFMAAKTGDTVLVKKGIYKEGELTLDKSIVLLGEDFPIIDGQGKYMMLVVKADHVTIQGFLFRNSGFANIRDVAAVRLQNVRHCKVIGNRLENNYFGIYLSNCGQCLVSDNQVTGTFNTESQSGNGIHNWKCDSLTIRNNFVKGHRDGIYFEFTKHSHILENQSTENQRYGLHFMFSDGNTYELNHFYKNGSGVAVMYSNRILMRNNSFEDNWGGAAYGLLLKNISHSDMISNTFRQNTVGIYIEESDMLNVKENTFSTNGWAMKIMSSSTGDSVLRNNFFANTFDVSTSGSANNNFFYGNYWDKYRGYDLDKNGKGDVGYRPVSLFSIIMERIPNAVMMMRSMIADILDQVERVYPQAIPESLTDEAPEMKPLHLNVNLVAHPFKVAKSSSQNEGRKNKPAGEASLAYLRPEKAEVRRDVAVY